jgi:hypothetical protein
VGSSQTGADFKFIAKIKTRWNYFGGAILDFGLDILDLG